MWLAYVVLFPGVAWVLPGYLASRWALPRSTPLERVVTSVVFGMGLVVPGAYTIPYVLRTPLTPLWILGAGLVCAGAFGALLRWRPRGETPPPAGETLGQSAGVAALVVALAVGLALTTQPVFSIATQLWLPCPHQASLFLLEDGSGSGLTAWAHEWSRWVTHVTEHALEPGYGIAKILRTQRIGSAATLAQHTGSLGPGGLVVASFTYQFLVIGFGALLFSRFVRSQALVAVFALLFALGCRYTAFYMVNETALAAGLGFGVLYLTLRDPTITSGALAGLLYALCVATRPECITYAPAALILLAPGWRRSATFGLVAAVWALPWLLTNFESFGDPFVHPSLQYANQPHRFLGVDFGFHPLNWPISDTLMRPDHSPYPTVFQLPLEHLQGFGCVFWLTALTGLFAIGWRLLVPLVLWALPNYLVLILIVSLDHEKLSYALMSFGPIALLCGRGVAALAGNEFGRVRKFALATVALVLFVDLPALTLPTLDLPVDPRKQYLSRADRFGDQSLDERRASLAESSLLPSWSVDDAEFALPWTWGLLTHSRPPQRQEPLLDDPVMVWVENLPYDRTYDVRLSNEPLVHPTIGLVGDGFVESEKVVAVSLRLDDSDGVVQFRVARHEGDVTVAVQSGGQGGGRALYLNLGLFENGGPTYGSVDVTVDDVPIQPTFFVAARGPERRETLRLVANFPVHFAPADDGFRLRAEPWPEHRCGDAVGEGVTAGPGMYHDTRGRDPAWLFTSSVFPPRRGPPCASRSPASRAR